jgi:Bacteriophage T4-like portal protein (Gp20)/Intein splicing domain
MENNDNGNLTVWQKLSHAFGPNALLNQDYPTYKFDRKDLLKTTSKQEYDKELLQAQQTYYLANQWTKIESNMYTQSVYYEPTRLASFYDYESMEYCIAGETKIATPDGFITIKELADKGRDYEFITYSYDHNLKKVVPAKARNAHYTRDEMTYKVIFDDNSYIITTWEHQLMKRDGSFERVMNLKEGDSMMPFYRKSFYNNNKYNWVYTCNKDEGHHGWISEHNLIAKWYNEVEIKNNEEVHHIDFNGKNNLPENLLIMDISEHRAYHARLNNEKLWSNPEYRLKMSEVAKRKGKYHWDGKRKGINNPSYFSIPFDNIIETARIEKTLKKTALKLNVSYRKLQRDITNSGYKDWSTFLDAYGIEKSKYSTTKSVGNFLKLNHKIVSIEPYEVIPVYDLTVPGYKNFATDTIFSHNTPEISAALDIYGEESTTVDENGYMLQIYSESKRIKSILADLFNNVMDVNTNLPMWVRNTCKYGDNFVYLKLDSDKGIVGCMQLPNIEIERLERGMPAQAAKQNIDEPIENKGLRFNWKAKAMEFNSWEIAHFRLLGDDRKLPYGTSMLEKARRIWKQLLLSEDAMLIYRTSRAPERRVFKVFVGNMDDKDVEPYVQRVANKFKRDQVVDSKTGNVDLRFNQMAVDQDYFIPVRDAAAPNPIDTLPGATNLSEIADIEYIQKKLLTALRVPKAFLGFEEPVGGGKDLSLMDIRFARTINRIQKCMIAELNKIAIIHLFLLGFEDELSNFTLGLTNPSSQADLLKVDLWKEKILLYKDAVTSIEGIAPVSVSWAKKHVLGFSDEEIKLDLQQQRIEKAVGAELTNTATIITHSGIFDNVDKLYGNKSGSTANAGGAPPPPGGDEGGGEMPPPPPPPGPEPGGAAGVTPESFKRDNLKILLESNSLTDEDSYIDLSKGKNSLGEMEAQLSKLLKD